jgi:hypothetical protein
MGSAQRLLPGLEADLAFPLLQWVCRKAEARARTCHGLNWIGRSGAAKRCQYTKVGALDLAGGQQETSGRVVGTYGANGRRRLPFDLTSGKITR